MCTLIKFIYHLEKLNVILSCTQEYMYILSWINTFVEGFSAVLSLKKRRNIRHRILKRVCVLVSSCEMREAVIICFLLNLYMGGQHCPRRTLLPGQICPGDRFARDTGSEVANWISYTLIDMAKAAGTLERRLYEFWGSKMTHLRTVWISCYLVYHFFMRLLFFHFHKH